MTHRRFGGIVTFVVLLAAGWLLWRRLLPRPPAESSPDWAPAAPRSDPPPPTPMESPVPSAQPRAPREPVATEDRVAPNVPTTVTAPHSLGAVRDRLASIDVDTSDAPDGGSWIDACDGECPDSHPVKAKLRSRLFHLPGMIAYARTNADRCYRSADEAETDGFSRAKR